MENCSICTENLENKNRIYLECGHSYHCTCIFRLFSHNDKKCPNCRDEIKYEVPQSELQDRLTRQNNTIKKLSEDISLLSSEYITLQSTHEETLRELLTVKIRRKVEVDLLNDEKKHLTAKIIKLSNEVKTLKDRIPNTELLQKNNKIRRLQTSLKNSQVKVKNLEDTLFDITEQNIKMADKYDDLLNDIKLKMNDMKASSSRLRLRSRISQPTYNIRSRRLNTRNYNRR